MMFLVIFSSLAATMGIVAQGNLRTAQTHLQVSRALAAAEAGLTFAERRLEQTSRRFIADRGEISEPFAEALWMGTYGTSFGTVVVRDPENFDEATPAVGIADALANAHAADAHQVYGYVPNDDELPYIDPETGILITRPISFESSGEPNFQVFYAPLDDPRFVRVTVIGRDQGVERVISIDYQLAKRLKFAILSPNRIMLGKNVYVQGNIGSRYDTLDVAHGHPMVTICDFADLSSDLDDALAIFHGSIAEYDADGDGRLRVGHSAEGLGIPDGMADLDGNGYVDAFDLFLAEFDAGSPDGRVVYDESLAQDAGHGSLSEEFDVDMDLAGLLDRTNPDRNADGWINGYFDQNGDGYISSDEFAAPPGYTGSYPNDSELAEDIALGYSDGILDRYDDYTKIQGSLGFTVSVQDWEDAQSDDWQSFVHGPIRPDRYDYPVEFEVDEDELLAIDLADFTDSQNGIVDIAATGQTFAAQVAAQGGSSEYIWERMPYRSPGFYDWYHRPVYRDMTFHNVRIPIGTNGLFVGCTFIGATHVQTFNGNAYYADGTPATGNTHINWNFYGTKEYVSGAYVDKYPILDKYDVPEGDEYLYTNYDDLPEALYLNLADIDDRDLRVRDTKELSNNIRFHDCEFRGSVVTDATATFTHVRNKLQFTGGTVFHEPSIGDDVTEAEYDELRKSSLMAPGYSVDIGTFNSPGSQDVNLRGTIISGIMDIRGNATIIGSLLMTYNPISGEGPLVYGGNPANFNSTFGYFGPDDGDGESLSPHTFTDTDGDGIVDVGEDYDGDGINDPWEGYGRISIIYDPMLDLPDGLMTPIQISPDPSSYWEGPR